MEKKSIPVSPADVASDAELSQWVVNLYQLPLNGALTSERIAEWKRSFQQLLHAGAVALPVIREFLERNVDVNFGPNGSYELGYTSARNACFDLLKQIGGPDAAALMLETLQTTADPREIATLADSLEQMAPGAYQPEILVAVRETLTVAANGRLAGFDVGPLFNVLQKYGDSGSVAVLEQAAGQWKYYATVSLAQLPDGAGVPALVQMAQNSDVSSGSKGVSIQVLAQVAYQYPEAADALVVAVKQNQIPESLWPYLVLALTEGQFQLSSASANNSTLIHITAGNQNFSMTPFNSDQLRQQLVLVNELLSVASNSTAIAALEKSRNILSTQLSQFTLQ